MKQFPINWSVRFPGDSFPLDRDWTARWSWETTGSVYLNFYIENKKVVEYVNYEEILVCGELKVQKKGHILAKLGFRKFMTSSQPSELGRLLVCEEASEFESSGSYFFGGDIIITKKCDVCAHLLGSGHKPYYFQPKSLLRLSKNFYNLVAAPTHDFADVVLISGGFTVPANKAILSARSSRFDFIFRNQMEDSNEGQVIIDDMDGETLYYFVLFIYSGQTCLTVKNAPDLLQAALKYKMKDLKKVCCKFLKSNVNLENVLRMIVLGDHLAEDLKTFAVEYLYENCTDFAAFLETEEWRNLVTDNPDFAMNILESALKCKDKK